MPNHRPPIFMPHAAHLSLGRHCRFHLATFVQGYVVSTVGEYVPDAPERRVALEKRGYARTSDHLSKIGFQEIGPGRLYETMVFPAVASTDCPACPYVPSIWDEVEARSYNDPKLAFDGHYEMVKRYQDERQ